MDDKKTTPVFSFGSMATQAPSKMTPAATPFSFITDGLTFGAPTPTLLTEQKAEVGFSFADPSKMTCLKLERGVPQTIVQKPAEASKKNEVRQAELPAKSSESAIEVMSIAMEDEVTDDAPAPPEEPVTKVTEPEELAAAPTSIKESTATQASITECAATTSEAAPAELAPASMKFEPSKAPAVFVFKPSVGSGQSASDIKKVTFDPSAWSSGDAQSFAFVPEETSRLVEAVQAKPTAAVSEPGDEAVGSKHVEDNKPAVPSKGDVKASILPNATETVVSDPEIIGDTLHKREEPVASSEVTSVNTDVLATQDNLAVPESDIIEDSHSEASEAPLQVPSSTAATQEESASPISSITSDSDEYQDLVAKLEALQSSICMLQKFGLNDEAVLCRKRQTRSSRRSPSLHRRQSKRRLKRRRKPPELTLCPISKNKTSLMIWVKWRSSKALPEIVKSKSFWKCSKIAHQQTNKTLPWSTTQRLSRVSPTLISSLQMISSIPKALKPLVKTSPLKRCHRNTRVLLRRLASCRQFSLMKRLSRTSPSMATIMPPGSSITPPSFIAWLRRFSLNRRSLKRGKTSPMSLLQPHKKRTRLRHMTHSRLSSRDLQLYSPRLLLRSKRRRKQVVFPDAVESPSRCFPSTRLLQSRSLLVRYLKSERRRRRRRLPQSSGKKRSLVDTATMRNFSKRGSMAVMARQ
jgi:hypothetical protein